MAQARRRKKFFDVEMPMIGKKTQLQAYEIEDLNNRYIAYDLSRALRGKGLEIKFKVEVKETKEDKGNVITKPVQLRLMSYFLRRMIRKGTNYVEDSFSVNCKDAKLRIKPFLITRKKVSRAVRKALRNKAKEEITKYVSDKSYEEIFDDIIKNRMQRPLSLVLKKVYPLSLCEIRVIRVEKEI